MTTKYAYVKSSFGTNTSTDTTFGSLQNEAFGGANLIAGNCYGTIYDAITYGSLTIGDYILCSSIHDHTYTASTNLSVGGVTILSVDDTAAGDYKRGAYERTSAYDMTFNGIGHEVTRIEGVSFRINRTIQMRTVRAMYSLNDCEFGVIATAGSYILFSGDAVYVELNDVDFIHFSTTANTLSGFSTVVFNGGTVNSNSTAITLFNSIGGGGGRLKMNNVDMSNLYTGSTIYNWSADSDVFSLQRCKIPSGIALDSGNIQKRGITLDATSSGTADQYYSMGARCYEGGALESTTVKRTGGATYDGTNGFSIEFQPNSNVIEYIQPLKIKIDEIELDLTSAKTLTFHVAMEDTASITPSTVTNDKYWIEIVQNDDTPDNALGITINTKPDILATPSPLTNASTPWGGLSLANQEQFQIPITTEIVSGMTNGQVTAYFCVAESVSTRAIFVDPSPVVS